MECFNLEQIATGHLRRDGILPERIENGKRPVVHRLHVSTSLSLVTHCPSYSPVTVTLSALTLIGVSPKDAEAPSPVPSK